LVTTLTKRGHQWDKKNTLMYRFRSSYFIYSYCHDSIFVYKDFWRL